MVEDFHGGLSNIDVILDIPASLFKETITTQIDNLRVDSIDYLEILGHKLRELENIHKEDPEKLNMVYAIGIDMYGHVINEVCDKFDISVHDISDNMSEAKEMAECLYRFFVIRFVKGIKKFIYKEIMNNKKEYLALDEVQTKRKDVTALEIRKRVKNKDDIIVLSNLNTIVDAVIDKCLTLDVTNTDYISKAASSSNYEANYLTKQFLASNIVGEFVEEIFTLAIDAGLMGTIRTLVNETFILKSIKK